MKIDSFEIKHDQYLCFVISSNNSTCVIDMRYGSFSANIRGDKRHIVIYIAGIEKPIDLEADFDLSPIMEAFMLANIDRKKSTCRSVYAQLSTTKSG